MNILISNDDGIAANGIRALSEELSKKHKVYIVAPDRERSAAGHSLTLHTPLRVEELDNGEYGSTRAWVTTGTPGDCVKIAINAILEEGEKPDLVISGINHGPNLGADILYSGTVSCAMEGAMMGYPSIAASLATMQAEYEDFKFPAKFISALVDKLKDFKFPPKSILNVNIPKLDADDIVGVAITELGRKMFTDDYEKRIDPRGKIYYWMAGELINEPVDAQTDLAAIQNNKISITPVTYDMTRTETLAVLDSLIKNSDILKYCKEAFSDSHLNIDLKSIKLQELLNKGHYNSVFRTNIPGYLIRKPHDMEFDATALEHYTDESNHVYAKDKTSKITLIKELPGEPLYGSTIDKKPGDIERWYKWFRIVQKLPDATFKNYYKDVIELRKTGYWFDNINPNNLMLDGDKITIIDVEPHTPETVNSIRFKDLSPLIDAIWLTNTLRLIPENDRNQIIPLLVCFIERLLQIAKNNNIGVDMTRITARPDNENILNYIIINNFLD